jgi:hypothetical protein
MTQAIRRAVVPGLRRTGPGRSRAVTGLAVVIALVATSFVAGRGIGSSLALLVSSTQSGGNAFTAGTWVLPPVTWYLHNNPTPPSANTAAQVNLGMDATIPAGLTLYNYDVGVDTAAGRRLQKSGSGPSETNLNRYANWLSPVLSGSRAISGAVTLSMWSAVQSFTKSRAGALSAYLRDYDPSTGTYVEIASGTTTSANWQAGSGTWIPATISIPVAGYTVPAGHRVEVKVMTTSYAFTNMWVAYDTQSYASSLSLP